MRAGISMVIIFRIFDEYLCRVRDQNSTQCRARKAL